MTDPLPLFSRARLMVPRDGFPEGTEGAIVEIYRDGVAYELDITHPRNGCLTVLRDEIEPICESV